MTSKAEKFARELQQARELHRIDVDFIRANPIHTPEVGAQKAKEFIAHLTALTEWIEKNYNLPGNECEPSPTRGEDTPAHYEVQAFFTPEQRAEVAALHARGELVEMRSKANNYDELVDTLWDIGLCPDLINGGPIIAVHDLHVATEWWKSAIVYKPPFDDEET